VKDVSLKEMPLASEQMYDGHLLKVYHDTVTLPDGKSAGREYIRHVGAVCIVALTEDRRVLMERQWRYPMAEEVWEIPAGKLDGKEEDPLLAARRELREETGAIAAEMRYLGPYYPTPAYSDEVIHMYLATGLTFGRTSRDEDEFMTVETVPLEELVTAICEGRVPDGKTQVAVLRVARLLS